MKHAKHEENRFLELTDDVILEILYRVPVKSLGRCKAVCKSWLFVISDPDFSTSHLEFSKINHLPLTLVSQRHNIISYLVYSDSTSNITKGVTLMPLDQQFICDDAFEGYYFIVGSCDGLICVYLKDKNKHYQDSMYVWNPIIDEEMEISLPVDGGSFYVHIDSCWFGFVPSLDDYKIFLVYTVYKPSYGMRMYLYSFRYSEWREMYYSDEEVETIQESNCAFMDEALHYIIGHKWMIKFDLVEGSFEKIPFSIKPDQRPDYGLIRLGVIGEYDCLCAMFIDYSEEWMFELWTLEEYDDWNSWEKQYRINLQEDVVKNCIEFLGFRYSGELCIQNGDGLMLVDPSCDPPSYVIARNPSHEKVYKVMDHVESLLSPDVIP